MSNNPTPQGDKLETIRDTGKALAIGRTKIWAMIAAGQLEAVRLGKKCTRVRRSSIDRIIAGAGEVD